MSFASESPIPNPKSPLRAFAPAKLNLYLHITGRRSDGYHKLDSLAAFTSVGDELRLEAAESFSLTVTGPQAVQLQDSDPADNLVVKAVHSLAELTGHRPAFHISLHKNLPVASGIGGGSADAAAALRLAAQFWGLDASAPRLMQAAERHGQDVPLCLGGVTSYLTSVGTAPGPVLPPTPLVMVNPNKVLPTPLVYQTYRQGKAAFSMPAVFTRDASDITALVGMLKERHNDLYAAACELMPEITDVIAALETSPACLLARMSGSGATCFGIYPTAAAAARAAGEIAQAHPGWWVAGTVLLDKKIC